MLHRCQMLNEHQEFGLTISRVTNLPKTLTATLSMSISCRHFLCKTHKFSSAIKADDSALDSVVFEKLDRDFFQPEQTVLESSCDTELTDRIVNSKGHFRILPPEQPFAFPWSLKWLTLWPMHQWGHQPPVSLLLIQNGSTMAVDVPLLPFCAKVFDTMQ